MTTRRFKIRSGAAPKILLTALVLVYLHAGASLPYADDDSQAVQTVTECSYHAGPGDSPEIARALALFGAQYEAVSIAARHLAGRGLLKNYGDRKMEIFCLVAGGLPTTILAASYSDKTHTWSAKIKSRVSLADFVRAEIRNTALEKEELQFTWKEEMEPVVPEALDPATELSRAYRYLRRHHWRMAIIYLDHLEVKYPHWGALFFAKAAGFEGMHETERAMEAMSSACRLGNREACIQINR